MMRNNTMIFRGASFGLLCAAGVYYTYTTNQHGLMFGLIAFFIAAVLYTLTREMDAMERQQKTEDVWNHIDGVRDTLNNSIDRLHNHIDGVRTEIEQAIDQRFDAMSHDLDISRSDVQTQIDELYRRGE